MPVVCAGRLPPTASVVDAVFDALEQEAPTSGDGWGLVGAIRKVRNRLRPMAPPKYVGFGGIEDYQEIEHEGLGIDAENEEVQYNVGMYVAINLLFEMANKMLCSGEYIGGKKKALKELIKRLRKDEHEYVLRLRPGDFDHDSASRYVERQVSVPRLGWDARKKIDNAVHYMIASDPSKYDD
ncbi:MAG: hypothetical protein CMK83_00875 [Pseudomonadales bacterium]|nr:hypothetical protein [Pseudomonadales bacterium]